MGWAAADHVVNTRHIASQQFVCVRCCTAPSSDSMGDMAISTRPRLDDLLARLGEQAGDIAVQCSDTGGIVGKLNRQISAEAERLEDIVVAMEALNVSRAERREATG